MRPGSRLVEAEEEVVVVATSFRTHWEPLFIHLWRNLTKNENWLWTDQPTDGLTNLTDEHTLL